jgi:hypothetical protein
MHQDTPALDYRTTDHTPMIAIAPHTLTRPCPAIVAIQARLAYLAASAQVAAEALEGGAALDLCPGSLDTIARELDTLVGRVDLVLDRLAAALDPTAAVFGEDMSH